MGELTRFAVNINGSTENKKWWCRAETCIGSNGQGVAEERMYLQKFSSVDYFKFLKQKPGHQLRKGQERKG